LNIKLFPIASAILWVLLLSPTHAIANPSLPAGAISYRIIEGGTYYLRTNTFTLVEGKLKEYLEPLPYSETRYAIPQYYIIGNEYFEVIEL